MLETETFADPRDSEWDDAGDSPARLISYYWGLVRKYYWIVLITSIVAVTAGYFWTKQQPRLYKTTSKLIFHEKQANVFGRNIDRVDLMDPGGRWQFEHFWNTQREVLDSRWFAERVVNRLDLLADDSVIPSTRNGEPIPSEDRMRSAVGRIRGMVGVELQRESRVALVTATSNDPTLSRDVANAFANSYIDYTREFQSGGLDQIVNWFDDYVATKRQELTEAQTDLHKFKRDKNILSISYEERQNLTAANMDAVNQELNQVENELSKEQALYEQLQEMQASGESAVDVARFAGAETLASLLGRQRELNANLADAQTVFGPKHEKVRGLNDQLVIIDTAIEEEISRATSDVVNRVAFLKRQRSSLASRLESLKQEAFELNELGLTYNQMQDRADSLRQLYDAVLKRSEELDINSLFESNSIQVLEEAELPRAPFSPNLPYNLGVALLVGLALGGGIIFLIAALDNTVKAEDDITRYTRAPVLGMLPEVDAATIKTLVGTGDNPLDKITHEAPKSSFAEGIKTLRTNLMFMAADAPPKLLLVTSPGPGEGKTLISTNMAIAMAQSGLRTVLVDNDLRRPRVHKALGIDRPDGLSDVIRGELELDSAIFQTDVPNLWAIPAGHIPPNPTELLHTTAFDEVIEELSERFDRVILDSPPVGAVADALILSRSVDAVLLVLKYGQTRKEMLKRTIDQLEAIGAPLMGMVLNDIKKDAAGYGYAYYYYRYSYEEEPESRKDDKLAS